MYPHLLLPSYPSVLEKLSVPGSLPVLMPVIVLESSQACPSLTEAGNLLLQVTKFWGSADNCVVLIILCHLDNSTSICFLLATCYLDSSDMVLVTYHLV